MSHSRHRRMDDDSFIEEDESQSCTIVVVIISLLFVAVFGGALVGGVVSGDPSNGFFSTIIAASSIAISIAAFVSIRYWLKNRGKDVEYIKEGRGTFNSDEDVEDVERQRHDSDAKRHIASIPPARRIKEVHAMRSMPGDVSALSPNTYDVESVDGQSGITSFAGRIIQNRSRQRKSGFDFSSVVLGQQSRGREDPPDAAEVSSVSRQTKQMGPKDPSAAKVTLTGIVEEELTDVGLNTPASRYDVENEDAPDQNSKKNDPKSPKPAMTPASEAGSFASSMFRGFFGSKKTEAAAAPAATSKPVVPAAGRPPKPGSNKPSTDKRALQTINGGLTSLNVPSTPGNNVPPSPGKSSVFSIPPPKIIPSTPAGASEVEYRSTAASSVVSDGAASSTFDPAAHQRALLKMQQNTGSLGATGNDMPIYYEDDVDGDESLQSGVYDVFAPPGPLGIVVDTTEKGCVVHSLRKTSSMQGLITPGDLILALDDVNVQDMDASSLTKLMAKKSQQTQRKFTLVAA